MRLADLELELRPRDAWEAVDLGQAMFRRWWWPLTSAWLLTFVPLAVGLGLVFGERPFVAFAILWWLLPLVERAPLFALGRRVFGGAPTLVDLMGELPRLWSRRVLWRLTIARLSPWRGVAAPVAVLEQSGGTKARRRASTLMGGGGEGSVAIGVVIACTVFVIGLTLAGVLGIQLVAPESVSAAMADAVLAWWEGEPTAWIGIVLYAIGCLALTAIGPLYVAINFALYLNRRIFLEGWDVEVAFRSLSARLAAATRRGAGVLVCVLAAFAASAPRADAFALEAVLAPLARIAQQDDSPADTDGDPQAVVERVLADEDFDTTAVLPMPVIEEDDTNRDGVFPAWLGELFAQLVRISLVVGLVVLLLYLVYTALRYAAGRRSTGSEGSGRPTAPVEVAGLDVRPRSMPDDPASAALALWQRGEAREALGLLYRSAIARVVARHQVPIADGDTEGLCLARVRSAKVPVVDAFGALTRAWQSCAYGDRLPDDAAFEGLVRTWRAAFASGPEVAA